MYLQKWKDKLSGMAGRPFYLRPQRYRLSYEVRLENHTAKAATVTAVCPLPPDFGYQTVSDVAAHPAESGRGRDGKFGNAYVWWTFPVLPGFGQTVGYSATLEVKPRCESLGSYRSLPSVTSQRPPVGDRYLQITDEVRSRARQAARGANGIIATARGCYEYVIHHLRYGRPIEGLYSATDALTQPSVDCGGFSTLLGAMLVSLEIPARVVVGFWAGHRASTMHAWVECALTARTWLPMDPSVEHLRRGGQTRKFGGFGAVGSDRVVVSIGCDYALNVGGRTVEVPILQNPVILQTDDGATESRLTVTTERL